MFFEIFFLIDILISFFTAYVDEDTNRLIKDLKKISKRYVYSNGFLYDLIPLIPLTEFVHFKGCRFLFFIKCIRIIKVFKTLNIRTVNNNVKMAYKNQLNKICQEDMRKAYETDVDHIHIVD